MLLTLATPVQAATPKAGAKCTKAGITATAAGKKFTCVKSGTKLVWSNGVAMKAAAPKPTATPTASAMPTPTKFEPWSTNIDSKMLSDEARRRGMCKSHTVLMSLLLYDFANLS